MVGKEREVVYVNQIFNLVYLIVGIFIGQCLNIKKLTDQASSALSYLYEDVEAETPEE